MSTHDHEHDPSPEEVDSRFADIVGEEAASGTDGSGEAPATGEQGGQEPGPTVEELQTRLAERTEDLQRLQAEYVNYKRRVDRDRDLSRQAGVDKVVSDLMPVLDSIHLARQHGELDGGFKHVAEELERLADRHGLSSFGEVGEEFDPTRHEALMQLPLAGAKVTSVSQVMQLGYRIGERVLRPARVAVSDPDPSAAVSDSDPSAAGGEPDPEAATGGKPGHGASQGEDDHDQSSD